MREHLPPSLAGQTCNVFRSQTLGACIPISDIKVQFLAAPKTLLVRYDNEFSAE